ncbi:MAG: protein kinase [Planctomycetia bacterium]|nr:protein kinase [Planctomycetia bacterium]
MSFSAGRRPDNVRESDLESTVDVTKSAEPQDLSLDLLEADALREMEAAWRQGLRTPAENWLDRDPQIRAQPEVAVRIIYEEVCLREERGELVEPVEIYRRFPQWQDALEVLLDCHRLVQPEHASATFPQAGQRLGELQLLSELDRGAVGRVFLATQPALSDRPLVVKLTPRSGDEHLSLARLQHTHIAPLYLVQDFPAENLRALCMPYLGGTSWARVLEDLKVRPPGQRTGRQIAELLAASQNDMPIALNFTGPALRFLDRATYVQAICWIGSCLADALHYAHQRGLLHLDIKPSNVLLAGDGQPMLLDFHLARQVIPAGNGPIDRLGGTRGYMSHEQELAATAVREERPISLALDGRSDIYSLGVLMYESLGGQLPSADETTSRRRLRQLNPEVSRGLEDVLHKCLARDPAARYSHAGELAADLRRQLADLPLCGVPNRSLKERWQKWRRRKPHAVALLGMTLIALVVTGAVGLLLLGDRLRGARLALAQGQQHIESRDYAPAIERLESGWDAIRWFPGQYDLKEALRAQLMLAKRARLAGALHELVERLRFVDGFETVPVTKLRELEAGCSTVWHAREQIAQLDAAASRPDIEHQLRTDLLDLALLWADLRIRLASAGQAEQARHKALELLDEAQQLCGPSPILELARHEYSAALGTSAPPIGSKLAPDPRTVWEHYAVGRWLFRSEKVEQAQKEFQQAIDLQANAFWPNFHLALCAYRLEHFDEALNAAYACVALSPKSAECFYNRALSHQALGHTEEALSDFSRASKLDPMLAVALLRRGMLLAELQRYSEATRDLETALTHGAEPTAVYYQMALVQVAQQDQTAALKSLHQALQHDEAYTPAAALKSRLEGHP